MLRLHKLSEEEPESLSTSDAPETSDVPQHRTLQLIRAEFEEQTWRAFEQVVIESPTWPAIRE